MYIHTYLYVCVSVCITTMGKILDGGVGGVGEERGRRGWGKVRDEAEG
jgi:hypothetical protein